MIRDGEKHCVLKKSMTPPFPGGCKSVLFGMGCFWGAERVFWEAEGVYTTAAGYSGGELADPSYEQVCSGSTGHAEVVLVVYDSEKTALESLLKRFWESHDPTQGNRQGNDVGSQYRSVIYTYSDEDKALALGSRDRFQPKLEEAGFGKITTEIDQDKQFYYAELYHQQYLHKNPNGYCGLKGACAIYPG